MGVWKWEVIEEDKEEEEVVCGLFKKLWCWGRDFKVVLVGDEDLDVFLSGSLSIVKLE